VLSTNGCLFLTRPSVVYPIAAREELLWRAGRSSTRCGARDPLAQAGRSHEDPEAGRTTGKSLLLPAA
jgi:NADPH2:quinone reductase